MNLSELKNESLGFDVAVLKPVFVGESRNEEKVFRAVYNVDKNKTASIVSERYNLVQHSMVVGAVTDAINNLNIEASASVRNGGNRVFVDINFTKAKLYVQKGEEFIAGVRIINSYDKTTGIMVLPHLVRLVCNNGMVMNVGWVKEYSIRHTTELAKDFQSVIEVMLKDMINSNDKLKAMINDCIGDSVEWQMLDRIMQGLIHREKHIKAITEIMKKDGIKGNYTRWDLYCSLTSYATHNRQLKPSIEQWLQEKAQKVLITPYAELIPKQK